MIPVVLILLAAGAWLFVLNKGRALSQSQETAVVLVARGDLPAGAVLNEDLVETREMPRVYLQQDAYEVRSMSDVKLINNLVAAVRIPKGNQITQSCLASQSAKAPANVALPPAQQHYLEGVKYFQNGNYEKARGEWKAAKKLDPANAEVAAGLERIERILSGTK
jgi:Flp pilus assembly protein CpaB